MQKMHPPGLSQWVHFLFVSFIHHHAQRAARTMPKAMVSHIGRFVLRLFKFDPPAYRSVYFRSTADGQPAVRQIPRAHSPRIPLRPVSHFYAPLSNHCPAIHAAAPANPTKSKNSHTCIAYTTAFSFHAFRSSHVSPVMISRNLHPRGFAIKSTNSRRR